jgi:D-alanine-D-alanine ligase
MAMSINTSEIPILLLFNLDPNWSVQEQEEVLKITSQLKEAISSINPQVTLVPVKHEDINSILSLYDPLKYLVFNWCESLPGISHSEWLVVEQLENQGFAFTGASSATISLAQDKCRIKQLLHDSGVQTPEWQTYQYLSDVYWNHFPAIVKPSREHCSEGIDRNAVVMTEKELKSRIAYIHEKYRQPALVEDFIDGRELHVTIWGNGKIDMLPPAEMDFSLFKDEHDHICSYESKFVPESEHYRNIKTILPAPLDEDELSQVERICKAAYRATGCRDYARIDLRLKNKELYVTDVNPNPDISPDTSTVSAAEIAGYSFGEFGGRIIRLAAQRHPVWGKPFVMATHKILYLNQDSPSHNFAVKKRSGY